MGREEMAAETSLPMAARPPMYTSMLWWICLNSTRPRLAPSLRCIFCFHPHVSAGSRAEVFLLCRECRECRECIRRAAPFC